LLLKYNLNLNPSQRIFQRNLNVGWNTLGISSPSYALKQYEQKADSNNPSSILNALAGKTESVIDFTYGNSGNDFHSIKNNWMLKTFNQVDTLNDFRELKGYGAYITQSAVYTGIQNNDYIVSSIGLTKNGDYPNQSIYAIEDHLIGSWLVYGSNNEDININRLVIDISSSSSFNHNNIKNAYLKVSIVGGDSCDLDTKGSLLANGNNWELNLDLIKGKVAVVELYADIMEEDSVGGSKLNALLSMIAKGKTSEADISPDAIRGQDITFLAPTVSSFQVALAVDNPGVSTLISGATAAQSQSNADLAHFTITNGSVEEVKITSVELQRLGISADATLASVYLFEGVNRLTDAGTVSSGKVTFNDSNGVIVIPAGNSKTIAVKAQIAGAANGQTVGIALSGLTANLQLNSVLPINGNIHSIASANLATVNFGTLLPGNTTSDPVDDFTVWQSTVAIGGRSVVFDKIAIKQINSIEAKDITNFRLVVDGTQLAIVSSIDPNGYVVFSGLNKALATGNRVVKVIADIIGGAGRIAQFSVRNRADVEFRDIDNDVFVSVAGVPATVGTITINQGVLSVTKASDSVSGRITNNGLGVSLAKYEFKAYGEPIKVETLTAGFAYVDAGGLVANAAATIRNGKIYVNGAQVGSTSTIAPAGTQFTTNFIVNPGTTTIVEIYGDVFDNDGVGSFENNDTLTFSLIAGAANASRQVSFGTLNVPTANTAGNQVIISEGQLTVTKASTYANQNAVVPQNNYKVGAWNILGLSTENVNVNTLGIDVTAIVGATFDFNDIKDAYLKITKDGTTTELTIKPTIVATGNTWPVSITLEKNKNMTVELFARLDAGATATHSLQATLNVAATGASSSTAINPAGVAGQTIAAVTGVFNITRAASSPVAAIVDDSGTVVTAAYKFEAQSDSYTIEEILVNMTATGITAVSQVLLKDGDTVIKTMPAAAAIVFGGLNVTVPANESKTLEIVFDMVTIGTGAGTSGADLTTNIQGAIGVMARSGSTGVSAAINTVAVPAGNNLYGYKSFPSLAAASLSDTNLTAGTKTLSKFSVTSNGGPVSWKQVKFDVTKSNTVEIANTAAAFDATKMSVVDTATGQAIAGAFTTNVAGGGDCSTAANTACNIVFIPTIEEAVSGTKTYELRGAISGALVTNNYITTEVKPSGNPYTIPNTVTVVTAAGSNFIWSDLSAQGHSVATLDWSNDNLLKTLPISQTLTNRN